MSILVMDVAKLLLVIGAMAIAPVFLIRSLRHRGAMRAARAFLVLFLFGAVIVSVRDIVWDVSSLR